ncbi:ECF transporter S component [Halanaerobium salsuginis]|jgi:ECF transporter S component (folate family)|uniref:Riboflavin transporter n=1 Tax=Halanaerobium salsuginis TaxID=29563 RepID=A0A1I4NL11_9FIRM|nr:ECF transporter S component [Halanaerobium salsuginis]SFM16178.1 ECF transporter S component, folate family [Halanaerobium salsuginis]
MRTNTKKLTMLAVFAALAFIVMTFGRIPIVLFLRYDPKDIIITIAGFIFGPLSSLMVTFIVALLEMFTVSDTGIIGFFMNIISTASFACLAAYIYQKNKSKKGAILGLLLGSITMTIIMLLWNYLITPIYLGYPRSEIVKLMLPAFLPFNLIKSVLNSIFTFLLYRPVLNSLKKANLIK